MNYVSTRNSSLKVTSAHAIVKGLSDEGGLFVPESIPALTKEEIMSLGDKKYSERAFEILPRSLDIALRARIIRRISTAKI